MIKIIYTGRHWYKGADRLDITTRGNDPIGRIFAPTWDMVMGVKKGTLSEAEYTAQYIHMMSMSVQTHHQIWLDVIHRPEVTFTCFCPAGAFCHRYTLKDIFVSFGCIYGGER